MNRLVLFFLFFFLLVFLPLASAIGISPSKAYLEYSSDTSFDVTYKIINNQGKPVAIRMEAFDSPLADFVEFSETNFTITGAYKDVTASFYLPPFEDITTYGDQYIRIRAMELPPESSGGAVSAVTSVQSWTLVHVPFPGQYGEVASIEIPHVNQSQNTKLTFEIRNRGSDNLAGKRAEAIISDFDGNTIETFHFSNINIPIEDGTTLTQIIPSAKYDPGKYAVTVNFYYDENKPPSSLARTFFVGTTDVQVIGYTAELQEGSINKVRVTLQSLWGSELRSIRAAIVDFENHSQAMPVIDLKPFEERVVETYIDVPLLNSSVFDVNTSIQRNISVDTIMTLQFPVEASNDVSKELSLTFLIHAKPLSVNEKKSIEISTTTLLVAGLAVIIIILIILVIVLIPKKKNEKKEKHSKR